MLYCSIVLFFVLQGFVIRHYDELCSASRIGILVSLIIVLHGSIVLFDTCDYGFCQGHRCQGHREESRILLLSSVTVLQLSKKKTNSKQITDAMKLVAYAKLRRAQQV